MSATAGMRRSAILLALMVALGAAPHVQAKTPTTAVARTTVLSGSGHADVVLRRPLTLAEDAVDLRGGGSLVLMRMGAGPTPPGLAVLPTSRGPRPVFLGHVDGSVEGEPVFFRRTLPAGRYRLVYRGGPGSLVLPGQPGGVAKVVARKGALLATAGSTATAPTPYHLESLTLSTAGPTVFAGLSQVSVGAAATNDVGSCLTTTEGTAGQVSAVTSELPRCVGSGAEAGSIGAEVGTASGGQGYTITPGGPWRYAFFHRLAGVADSAEVAVLGVDLGPGFVF